MSSLSISLSIRRRISLSFLLSFRLLFRCSLSCRLCFCLLIRRRISLSFLLPSFVPSLSFCCNLSCSLLSQNLSRISLSFLRAARGPDLRSCTQHLGSYFCGASVVGRRRAQALTLALRAKVGSARLQLTLLHSVAARTAYCCGASAAGRHTGIAADSRPRSAREGGGARLRLTLSRGVVARTARPVAHH